MSLTKPMAYNPKIRLNYLNNILIYIINNIDNTKKFYGIFIYKVFKIAAILLKIN